MAVGERRFAVTLADTEAARAFVAQLPLTLDMPDLNGNEKHVKLPKPVPASATRPGPIRNGDLMLWGADTLVVFYLPDRAAQDHQVPTISRARKDAAIQHSGTKCRLLQRWAASDGVTSTLAPPWHCNRAAASAAMRCTITAAGSIAWISPAASPNQTPVCSGSPASKACR